MPLLLILRYPDPRLKKKAAPVPQIKSDGVQVCEEECLSVPGIFDSVKRAEYVVVRYLDLDGKMQTIFADGLLAVCLQHEINHLDGRVFSEHLSLLTQTRIKAKQAKQARITA